jgi:WD40 repeat protein
MIVVILLGILSAGCLLFSEKDINKRAGKAQIQSTESESDGVQVLLQKGHSSMIQAVVVSRNGRMVMTGSEDETARLWDVGSGQVVRSFVGFTIHGPHALAFGSEGQVVIGDRRAVGVYDATTGREIRSINVLDRERFVVSPDGRVLVTAGGTVATKIDMWDLTTGLELSKDPAGSFALPLAFSSEGHRLVTQRRVAGVYGSITVWETATGKKVKTVDHSGEVRAAALSPDGRMLALQAADRTIVVKDVDSSRVLQQFSLTLSPETGRTTGIRFSPDSRLLATADSENLVRLWDLHTGREAKSYRGTAVDFGNDGKTLVVGVMDGTPLLRNLDNGTETKFSSGGTTAIVDLAVTSDGRKALVAMEDGTVKLWDLTTGQILRSLTGPAESSIAISRIGGLLATAGGGDGSVAVWEFMTGRKLLSVKAPQGTEADVQDRTVVSLSPDGSLLAVGLRSRVSLYDVLTGKELRQLTLENPGGLLKKIDQYVNPSSWLAKATEYVEGSVRRGQENMRREYWVRALALSPDGKYLATAMDRGIYLWDSKTGKFDHQVLESGGALTKEEEEDLRTAASMINMQNLAFSSEGEMLIGAGPTWIGKWELHPGVLTNLWRSMSGIDPSVGLPINRKRELGYRGLGVSLDGKLAVLGHGRLVKLWDVENDRDLRNLTGHTADVTAVAMTPDGRLVISGSQDGMVKVWEAKTGQEVASLMALGNEDYVAVTPDQYYRTSNSRLKGVAFRMKDQLFPFEQFDLRLNRPDIVLKRLGRTGDDMIESYRRSYARRLKKMGLTEQMLGSDFHLPEIELLTKDVPVSTNAATLTMKVRASDSKYPLDRFNVFLNDVPLYGRAGLPVPGKQLKTHEQEVQVQLVPGRNKIQVSVLNSHGVESLKQTLYTSSTAQRASPEIYVVSIGVSEYKDKAYNLRYAAKDAEDLIAAYKAVEQRAGVSIKVHLLSLNDQKATKSSILGAKDWLKQSKVNDLVVVFAAGHGMTDEKSDYYFGTHDIDPQHPATNGLPYEEFENLLDGIPALHKVLLLDTCFSGEIDKDQAIVVAQADTGGARAGTVKMRSFKAARGVTVQADASDGQAAEPSVPRLSNDMLKFQQDWFADLRRGTGAAVISSSSGNEYSLEGEQWGNGVFTYSLLNGLKNREADSNKDQIITVSELQAYVIDQVRKLTDGGQNPTVRRENLESDFAVY